MKISKLKLGMAMAMKSHNFKTLSEASGISRTTLSAINNGKSCKGDIVIRLAAALGVTPSELVEAVN